MKYIKLRWWWVMALLPGCAFAQSSVILYGRYDVAVDMVHLGSPASGQGKTGTASELGSDTSYWGVIGSEPLGDGWRTYFKLETGFNGNSGSLATAGQPYNRESYVGIGGPWGSLQLGGQFAPAVWVTGKIDPFQRSMNGLIQNILQAGAANNSRGFLSHQNNAVQYISPTWSGVTMRAMYVFGDSLATPAQLGQVKSMSLEYAHGPFYGAFTFESSRVAARTVGSSWNNNTYTLGGTYDLRWFKLHGFMMFNTLTDNPDSEGYMVGVTVPAGPGTIRASWTSRKFDDTPGSTVSVAAIGYTYDLSKRTMLYTSFARLHNGATATYALWPSSKVFGLPAPGQTITSLEFGIRHMF